MRWNRRRKPASEQELAGWYVACVVALAIVLQLLQC